MREYVLIEKIGATALERCTSGKHLIHKHSQRPPVAAEVVASVEDDFGAEVFRGAAESVGLFLRIELLGEAEISKFYVTCSCYQNIFGF